MSRRTQRLIEIELEAVKVFQLVSWGYAAALEIFLIVWLGRVVAIKDSHLPYNNAWFNPTSLNSSIYTKVLDTSLD